MGPPSLGLLVVGGQLHRLAGELRVKVVQAVVVRDLRLEGRQRLLLLQLGTFKRSHQGPCPRAVPQTATQREAQCISMRPRPWRSEHTDQQTPTRWGLEWEAAPDSA